MHRPIHQALSEKDLAPREHFVDGASISADVARHQPGRHGITLRGPTRPVKAGKPIPTGAYTIRPVHGRLGAAEAAVPQGKRLDRVAGVRAIGRAIPIPSVASASRTAGPVTPARSAPGPRTPGAVSISRRRSTSKRCQRLAPGMPVRRGSNATRCRAGVEGTLSQGVRAFGLRRTRYRGLEKTHLQHVAIAAAINIDRIVAWLEERPRATTRTSRFAALAPVHDLPSETPSV